MANLTCRCGKAITEREKKLNAGLCGTCLQAALRAEAKRIAKRQGK